MGHFNVELAGGLETLQLAVDPVGRRLVPTKFFAMPSVRRSVAVSA